MIAALVLGLAGLAAGQTAPACSLSLEPPAAVVWRGRAGGGYDPLDPTERWQVARFRVHHEGPACEFWVAVEDLDGQGERRATGSGDAELRYRLADAEGRPPGEAGVYGGAVAVAAFGEGSADATVELRVILPPGQESPPGDYRDVLTLRLFEGPVGMIEPRATALLQVRFEVAASLELELGSPPGGELDLGELSGGAAGTLTLRVRGNAAYRLTVRSESRGLLRAGGGGLVVGGTAVGGAAAGAAGIAYRLQVAGLALAVAGDLELRGEAPGAAGRDLALEIQVPPAAGAVAGSYRDTLIFSVSAD